MGLSLQRGSGPALILVCTLCKQHGWWLWASGRLRPMLQQYRCVSPAFVFHVQLRALLGPGYRFQILESPFYCSVVLSHEKLSEPLVLPGLNDKTFAQCFHRRYCLGKYLPLPQAKSVCLRGGLGSVTVFPKYLGK